MASVYTELEQEAVVNSAVVMGFLNRFMYVALAPSSRGPLIPSSVLRAACSCTMRRTPLFSAPLEKGSMNERGGGELGIFF